MSPLRVYLDTSDYGSMYLAPPDTFLGGIRQHLLEQVQNGYIEIGLSYLVIFELLQWAEPQYRADRLARAQLLKDLCGQNAFAFYGDLAKFPAFSTEGNWYPRTDALEIEAVVKEMMLLWAREPGLNRQLRRLRSKRVNFVDWVRRNPRRLRLLPGQNSPLPFAQQFIESGACRSDPAP